MSYDIILCGVGGQGTILASKLLANASMDRGLAVKTAETIGMAQRGGSVFSHVRIGEASCPLIGRGRADPIVPASAMVGGPAYDVKTVMDYLRAKVEHLVVVDADAAARDLGSAKCLNVVLLGAASRACELGLSEQDLLAAIHKLLPQKLWELNERALAYTTKND